MFKTAIFKSSRWQTSVDMYDHASIGENQFSIVYLLLNEENDVF